jgi:hypothetical protein
MQLPTYGNAFRQILRLAHDNSFSVALSQARLARGAGNERLCTTYFTSFAPDDKSIIKALVVISGVHGVEGHIGHLAQCRIIENKMCRELPPDTGLILIHLVNPWGMSHGRRVDEQNIDNNRGCHFNGHGANRLYDEVRSLIEPERLDNELLNALRAKIASEQERRVFFAAAVSGQWHAPKGIFYGGDRTCIGGELLSIACQQPFLAKLKRVVAIDVHSGLGPRGKGTLLCPLPSNEGAEADKTRTIFGDAVQFINAGKPTITTSVNGDYLPAMKEWLGPKCDFTGIALEMGTTTVPESFPAIVAENWLHNHPERTGEVDRELVKEQLKMFRRTFAPLDEADFMDAFYAVFDWTFRAGVRGFSL